MTNLPPVARALDDMHVPYRLFVHAAAVHSLEQAARERHQLPDQVIRSIVFRVGKDEFLMVLMAGDRQISWPALRHYLGQSRLTLATVNAAARGTAVPPIVSPAAPTGPVTLTYREGDPACKDSFSVYFVVTYTLTASGGEPPYTYYRDKVKIDTVQGALIYPFEVAGPTPGTFKVVDSAGQNASEEFKTPGKRCP